MGQVGGGPQRPSSQASRPEEEPTQARARPPGPHRHRPPHYEAACSCAPLEIKAAIYSAHPNGAPLYGAGHKDPKQVS